MKKLIIIRHGQSIADIEMKCEGRYDSPLTELGIKQAEHLANYFKVKEKQIDVIYTSPLSRALATAKILSKNLQINFKEEKLLLEMDNGEWAGMLKSERDKRYPRKSNCSYGRTFTDPIPNGESYCDLYKRAKLMLSKIIDIKEENVSIVSHGGFINAFLSTIASQNMEIRDFPSIVFSSGDTGWHELKYFNDSWIFLKTNVSEHLNPK